MKSNLTHATAGARRLLDEAVIKGGYSAKDVAEYTGKISTAELIDAILTHTPKKISVEELKQVTTQESLNDLASRLSKIALEHLLRTKKNHELDAATENNVLDEIIDFVVDHFEPYELD